MNDREIDQLLRELEPAGEPGLEGRLREAGRELLEEIMSGESALDRVDGSWPEPTPLAPGPSRPTVRRAWLVGVAAAVVAAVVLPTLVFGGSGAETPAVVSSAPASPAVPTPESLSGNPHLLLDEPGWTVSYVSESGPTEGSVQFQQKPEGVGLEVTWDPLSAYRSRYGDRRAEHKPQDFVFLGQEAVLFPAGKDSFEVLAKQDDVFLDVRSSGTASRQDFEELLSHLKPVTAEQWFAAMPDSVVTPEETTRVAAEMTADIQLPKGFDTSVFTTPYTNDFYQFGARIVQKVTCAWLEDYVSARADQDESVMAAADAALSAGDHWKVERRMGTTDPMGAALYLKAVSERRSVDGYRSNLGCDDF